MALLEKYKAEIKKLTVDIDHLDAAIRQFDPDADTYAIKEYVTKHRAEKGSVKRFLKGELKRRGVTYAQLAEKLRERGAHESERNLANKISRGSFTAAFFMMCMDAIGARQLSLEV